MDKEIVVYGTDWCPDTMEAREYLDARGISYRYTDIEEDPVACDWVLQQNDGKQKTPTVDVNGLVLSVPSNGMLATALRRQGIISRFMDTPEEQPEQASGAGPMA